jgi:hypothetical protein
MDRRVVYTLIGLTLGVLAVLLWRCQSTTPQLVQAPAPDAAPIVAVPPDAAPVAVVADAAPPTGTKAELKATAAPAKAEKHREPKAPKEAAEPAVAAAAGPPPEQPAPPPTPPDAAPVVIQKPDAEALEKPPSPVERKKGTVVVHHHNGMTGSFHLIRILDMVDGAPVFERSAPNGSWLDEPRDLDSPPISATLGQHELTTRLEYTAASRGVFTYAEGYKFRVKGQFTFTVNPDRMTEVTVKGYEKGNVNTQLADKPAVEFQSKSR